MKITVLTYLEKEGGKVSDVAVEQVAEALRQGGHTVSLLGVHGDIRKLMNGLVRRKPEVVFNLLESFGDDPRGYISAAGVLDLLGFPYTGGGPGELYLQEDKALTKKLLAFDQINYPDFTLFSRDSDLETGGRLRMPLFVKPLTLDASLGIDGNSLVHSATEMMQRVLKIHEKVNDSALVEEYIEGREFYVGVLGNQDPIAFPPIEIDFSGLPDGTPHVMDAKAKWDTNSAEYRGTKVVVAQVTDEVRARLQKVALTAYRALRVRDYGRIDMRLAEDGEVYVIEVNASCYLERASEFAMGAAAHGFDFPALINRIVEEAVKRRQRPLAPSRSHRRRSQQKTPAT